MVYYMIYVVIRHYAVNIVYVHVIDYTMIS